MCSSVDYWWCRWIKLGGALEYPQRGPSDPHPGPDLSTACPQGYPQGWREDPQGVENGARRCGDAHISPRRRRGRRRAGPTGRSASRSPCGKAGSAPPLRLWLTAALPRHRSPRAVPSARSRWARSPVRHPLAPGPRCPVEAVGVDPRRAGAAGATPRLCPIRAPVPTGVLDGGHRRSVIADQDRVGVGGPPGSTRAWTSRWTPLHARPSPHPSRSPRPSRRGHGRSGGGAIRRLKKVAGAYLSPPAPRSSHPEMAQ